MSMLTKHPPTELFSFPLLPFISSCMIFDPVTAPQLKPWLLRTLEPICDAEPGALADYILALLKHNVPETEMRKELAVQLDEFLENECTNFIDTLFTVLRTKSYVPYTANPPSPSSRDTKPLDTGIPIPLDGLISPSIPESRSRKRSMESDDRDARPPAKGPRLNSDSQFSRYGANSRQDGLSSASWNDRGDSRPQSGYRDGGGGAPEMYRNGGHTNGRYQPPDQKRGICRDYHNYGYCSRGALCKFSHGEDAVVPSQFFPPMNTGMPFLPMFPNGAFGPAVAYDPHEARMDMRPMNNTRQPHQRAPLLPRVQQEDGSRVVHPVNATGELPVIQDLTPSEPQNAQQESEPQQQPPQHQQHQHHQQSQQQQTIPIPEGYDQNMFAMAMNAMNGFSSVGMNMDVDMPGQAEMPTATRDGSYRGSRPHRGRGRGTFSGQVHNFHAERHTSTTLVVEKIPQDKLSLEHVNDWFKRFGTVTNVAIDANNAKALVSFSKHEEAHAAWKSEDAVFSNRFVKVFWHRPMEGHGQVGARMLAASAPLVASMQAKEPGTTPPSSSTPTPTTTAAQPSARRPTTSTSSSVAALAAKQKLLEEQITEQKSLMAQLATTSGEEKKEVMARLRKLGEEMKKPAETPPAGTRGGTPTPSTSSASGPMKRSASAPMDDRERLMREKLDRELEMHNASLVVVDGSSGSTGAEDGGDTMEDLKAKLDRLKAEAASLGISDGGSAAEAAQGGFRGGWYRGRPPRGGARSYYRGGVRGGGPPRASMKLDNRPKRLVVKGARDEHTQAVREWFNATGQVDSVETIESGDVVVSFRSRPAAEQALAKGTNIPDVGSVQLTWYTGTVPPAPGNAAAAPRPSVRRVSPPPAGEPDDAAHHPRSPIHEEEVVASGWGGGDDDGDGMGMI